jgi:hypothetical protein
VDNLLGVFGALLMLVLVVGLYLLGALLLSRLLRALFGRHQDSQPARESVP